MGTKAEGFYHGRHYTEWVEPVKQLKRDGQMEKAASLLQGCANATFAQAEAEGWPSPPTWYSWQLAIVRRKQGDAFAEAQALRQWLDRCVPGDDLERNEFQERLDKIMGGPARISKSQKAGTVAREAKRPIETAPDSVGSVHSSPLGEWRISAGTSGDPGGLYPGGHREETMGRKRGFFAELQHQSQLAAKRQEQEARAAARAQAAAVREAEAARKRAEKAEADARKTAAANRKAAEQMAKKLHVTAMEAEAAARNARIAATYDAVDSMLSATLEVDDFVDLESLRAQPAHPPFNRTDLEQPIPAPPPILSPPEPVYVEPPAPTGLGGVFGGKKRHAEEVAKAQAAFAQAHEAWQVEASRLPGLQLAQAQEHQRQEAERLAQLAAARATYDVECQKRQVEADQQNERLDALITGLAAGDEDAVQEYISIVLENSVYPEQFPVEHDFEFDSSLKELSLAITIPGPECLPGVKAFKYTKSSDEITSTALSQKDRKDRYAGALHQVTLRSLHEVFEADRGGHIQSISLTVSTESIDPATGQVARTSLAAVAADRETFLGFDLSYVVPVATLEHMKALVSKNPFGLVAIDESKGVRAT